MSSTKNPTRFSSGSVKSKKQERFLKKFGFNKIVDKPKEENRFSIPLYLQKGVL